MSINLWVRVKVLDNVLDLTLFGEAKDGSELKIYSYSRLCDVQSKLMLVAGKAEKGIDDVDKFVDVSEGHTHHCLTMCCLRQYGIPVFI